MADYVIQVRQKDGTKRGEFKVYSGLKFSTKLNRPGQCSFSVPVNDPKLNILTSLRNYEVYIIRNGTVVWAGEQAHRTGRFQRNTPNWVTITCYDWLELFRARITGANRVFPSTDAGTIAWTLIDESQSATDGDFGITPGTIETTKNRDRTYSYKNIMDAIIQLSEVQEGFDFEFTQDKEINIYASKGADLSASVKFEWGTNIDSISIEEDFTSPVNDTIALGAGFGSSQVTGSYVDSNARSVHKLREARISAVDVSESDTLDDKAESYVKKHKQPVLSLGMLQSSNKNPQFGTLKTGDIIKVEVSEGIYNIDNKFRIYGYNVSVDDDNKESIEYLVSIQT